MARPRKSVSHLKELYYIIFIFFLAAIASLGIWGRGGYAGLKKARAGIEVQRALVESLKQSNSERLKSIQALRSDKEALERYAREKGYARKDELVQQLLQDSKAR
jgi:cell division protein FtsB